MLFQGKSQNSWYVPQLHRVIVKLLLELHKAEGLGGEFSP